MNRLEELLGPQLWAEVAQALAGKGGEGKNLELAVANDGSYIPKAKFDNLNREYQSLKAKIEEADAALLSLEEIKAEKEELQGALVEADEQIKTLALEKETAVAEVQRDFCLDQALNAAGAKNIKAVKALLNTDEIVWENQELKGIDSQILGLKEEAPYLFGGDRGVEYTPRAGGGTTDFSQMSDAEYYRLINRKG